jgi:RNA polymerase sigma-70 factor (ECF subfamily)
VCRHRALDVRRKEDRMVALVDHHLETAAAKQSTPAMLAEQKETTIEIFRLVKTLPSNQQEVLRLKFQADLSYEEISRVTKLSVSNVGFLLHTALKALRQKMIERQRRGQL